MDIALSTGWAVASAEAVASWPPRLPMERAEARDGVEYGTLQVPRSQTARPGGAGVHLDSMLTRLVARQSPTIIVKEAVFIGANRKTSMFLASLGMIAEMVAYLANVPIYDVGAVDIKKYVCGSGRAKKPQIVEWARRMGWNPANEDEADALALLEYSINMLRVKHEKALNRSSAA